MNNPVIMYGGTPPPEPFKYPRDPQPLTQSFAWPAPALTVEVVREVVREEIRLALDEHRGWLSKKLKKLIRKVV
jgi:hypothetical protein